MRLRHLAPLGVGLAFLPLPYQADAQSLDAVTEAALRHSPAVMAADARADAAVARLDLARAQRRPDLTAQGQIGTGWIDPRGFFGLQAAGTTPRVGEIDAEMPLVTFGRIAGGIAQARGGSKAAQLAARQVRLNLRVEVAQAYSQAVAAKHLANSYDLLRLSLTEMVRQSRLKFTAGSGTSTETAQAEARLAEADAGLAGAKGELGTAMAQLRTLSGVDVTLDDALPMPPQVPATRDEAVADALAANPQLLGAAQVVEAARGKESAAKAEAMPVIGAYAQASSVRDQFFPGYSADSAEVGLRLKWNFLSFGRSGAKARAATSELDAAQADYDGVRLRTEQAAITAFSNYETAKLMLAAAQARNAATKEALRGTKLEVEAGAKPQLAQLDAEREAIDADATLTRAQGQLITTAYVLRAVAGIE